MVQREVGERLAAHARLARLRRALGARPARLRRPRAAARRRARSSIPCRTSTPCSSGSSAAARRRRPPLRAARPAGRSRTAARRWRARWPSPRARRPDVRDAARAALEAMGQPADARAERLAPEDGRRSRARLAGRPAVTALRTPRARQGQPLPLRRRRRAPTACHPLVSLVQPVTLADELRLEPAPPGAPGDEVVCPGVDGREPGRPGARRLPRRDAAGTAPPQRLTIAKRVPVAAGMGGGSGRRRRGPAPRRPRRGPSAATRCWPRSRAGARRRRRRPRSRPARALVTGAGEHVEPLPDPGARAACSSCPLRARSSTAAVYREADRLGARAPAAELDGAGRGGRAAAAAAAALPDGARRQRPRARRPRAVPRDRRRARRRPRGGRRPRAGLGLGPDRVRRLRGRRRRPQAPRPRAALRAAHPRAVAAAPAGPELGAEVRPSRASPLPRRPRAAPGREPRWSRPPSRSRRRPGPPPLGGVAVAGRGAVAVCWSGSASIPIPNLENAHRGRRARRSAAGPTCSSALLAFLETGAFIGLIAPGETAVLVGGVVAGPGRDRPRRADRASCGRRRSLGDLTSYLLGRRLGRDFLVRHGRRVKITEERLEQVERLLRAPRRR